MTSWVLVPVSPPVPKGIRAETCGKDSAKYLRLLGNGGAQGTLDSAKETLVLGKSLTLYTGYWASKVGEGVLCDLSHIATEW